MKKKLTPVFALLLVLLFAFFGVPGGEEAPQPVQIPASQQYEILTQAPDAPEETAAPETEAQPQAPPQAAIAAEGSYTSKEDVALYIHTYGVLPENFMTKSQARKLGWEGGSVEAYAPGMCIGGDRFGNYEGLLPEDRNYTECDIDTLGRSSRGAKRIVFSDDGLIYYTDDHYESFELLYGEP